MWKVFLIFYFTQDKHEHKYMLQYKQQFNLSNSKNVMYHSFQHSCNIFYATKNKLKGGDHDNHND